VYEIDMFMQNLFSKRSRRRSRRLAKAASTTPKTKEAARDAGLENNQSAQDRRRGYPRTTSGELK
jgi:signal recognition particle subunit SEC65